MTHPERDELIDLSRGCWQRLELLHVVGYFAPEPTAAYVDLGLHPKLSYFPARAAAFGRADPGLTIATFYVFAPWLVRAALPSAWEVATPDQLVAARRSGMAKALDGILGRPDVAEALALARAVCEGLTLPGRPLFAAHAALPWPDDDVLALWHAATLVREHRGDGHVSVLQAAGIGPVEATVLGGIFSANTEFLRKTRGWSDEEWQGAEESLRARGWLEGESTFTESGRAAREEIERRTDDLALEGWAHVGEADARRLRELLRPLAQAVLASGVLPRRLGRVVEDDLPATRS